MRQFFMNLTAVIVALTVTGLVSASGPRGQGNHGMSGNGNGNGTGMKQATTPSQFNKTNSMNSSKPNSVKFQGGTKYLGKDCKHWSSCYFNGKYGCYFYFDPFCRCYYYYCAPQCCFYPVTYIVTAPPVIAGGAPTSGDPTIQRPSGVPVQQPAPNDGQSPGDPQQQQQQQQQQDMPPAK